MPSPVDYNGVKYCAIDRREQLLTAKISTAFVNKWNYINLKKARHFLFDMYR